MSYRPNQKPYTTTIEALAAVLEKNRGAINHTEDGTLIRVTGAAAARPWDMDRMWYGRELDGYRVRKSLWDKTALITFYCTVQTMSPKEMPAFTLRLKLPLTDEEIATTADSYLMILNMRRGAFNEQGV